MSQAHDFAQLHTFKACLFETVRQSSESDVCGCCKTGKLHKKPLVTCVFGNKFLPEKIEIAACFMCLQRTFRIPKETTESLQQAYNRAKNIEFAREVFDVIATLPQEMTDLHPLISNFLRLHNRGFHVTPKHATTMLKTLLVYRNDSDLVQGYLFLRQNRCIVSSEPELHGLLQKFQGGLEWPTVLERQLVKRFIATHHP